jgi:transcriptional regulator with XRE-family HTH domain
MDSLIVEWLKKKRIEAGLDMQDLASLAGSSTAQISRLETGSMRLTLNFLIVLVWALKIDLDEFASEFNLPPIVLPDVAQPDENFSPELADITTTFESIPYTVTVLEFARAFENAIPDAVALLEEKLTPAIKNDGAKNFSPENLRHRLQTAIQDGDLLPNPPGLTLEMLEHWFQKGGALTLADAGTYLKLTREQKKYTLETLAKPSNMTKSTINRIENALGDRFQFQDIVNLDVALQANGKILSMYWVVVMHQMGLWFSMKDTQRQPIKKGQTSHLVDTFIKVTRWSYLYDDPSLPWIEPWIAPVVEVDNALQLFSAYIRGDQHDYLRLAEEIRTLIPYKVFLIEAGEYPRKSASPDVELGLRILHDIKQAIGDDVFGLRILEMYQNNFNDPDYAAAFRVLLRELMVGDGAFFEKMREVLEQKK